MILITGASGLVGSEIFNSLCADYDVIGTSYSSPNEKLLNVDLLNLDEVKLLCNEYKFTRIIHCATIIPSKAGNLDEVTIYDRNLAMVLNLLKCISPVVKFINISTTSLYDLKGKNNLNEFSKKDCETLYQLSKKNLEELLENFYKTNNENYLNFRISSPYSVNKKSDTILYTFINKAKANIDLTLWGSGNRVQSFTNVETFSKDLIVMLKKNCCGTYNYVTTNKISMKDFVYMIKSFSPQVKIKFIEKKDPEEECQCAIDTTKLLNIIKVNDNLKNDIKYILGN